MTEYEIKELLKDDNRKITKGELKNIINDLMLESGRKSTCVKDGDCEVNRVAQLDRIDPYYKGAEYSFYTILKLMEHLEVSK